LNQLAGLPIGATGVSFLSFARALAIGKAAAESAATTATASLNIMIALTPERALRKPGQHLAKAGAACKRGAVRFP